MNWLVIGVDPGPIPGIVALRGHAGPNHPPVLPVVLQCHHDSAVLLVETLLASRLDDHPVIIAVEQFVVGPRAARSRTPQAGATTRNLVGALRAAAVNQFAQLEVRSAVTVKPWATDARLAAAKLVDPTKGMPHARDAARHALFAAVHAGLLADPLSVRAGA